MFLFLKRTRLHTHGVVNFYRAGVVTHGRSIGSWSTSYACESQRQRRTTRTTQQLASCVFQKKNILLWKNTIHSLLQRQWCDCQRSRRTIDSLVNTSSYICRYLYVCTWTPCQVKYLQVGRLRNERTKMTRYAKTSYIISTATKCVNEKIAENVAQPVF
jgi:hypothetical protein